MKTNPSEVFLLQKIDTINVNNRNSGAPIDSILEGIDEAYGLDVVYLLNKLRKIGVIEQIRQGSPATYKLTGKYEGASYEVKHYVKNRVIPD